VSQKTVDDFRRAISQAVSRAYGASVYPVEISTEHADRDVRSFILKTAGKPHKDLTVAEVAALSLSRVAKMSGDDALASTIADLIDGGVSLDRQAAAPRNLDDAMARHRKARARSNPLPSDRRIAARADAPRVVKRGGGSALAEKKAPPAPPAPPQHTRVAAGATVKYRRLDDGAVHEVVLGAPSRPDQRALRVVPMSSPLAQALVGATRGTIASARLGSGTVELEVLEVG
jgi:hypothetical protein